MRLLRFLDRIAPRPGRAVRRAWCEVVGHRTYTAPSGTFIYCTRCFTTIRSPLR